MEITFNDYKVLSDTYVFIISGIESHQKGNITIYPIPAHNRLVIDAGEILIRNLILTEIRGVEVLKKTFNRSGLIEFDIEHLAAGIFILTVYTDDHVNFYRITKE